MISIITRLGAPGRIITLESLSINGLQKLQFLTVGQSSGMTYQDRSETLFLLRHLKKISRIDFKSRQRHFLFLASSLLFFSIPFYFLDSSLGFFLPYLSSLFSSLIYLHCFPPLFIFIVFLPYLSSLFSSLIYLHCFPPLFIFIVFLPYLSSLFSSLIYLHCFPPLFIFIVFLPYLSSLFSSLIYLHC